MSKSSLGRAGTAERGRGARRASALAGLMLLALDRRQVDAEQTLDLVDHRSLGNAERGQGVGDLGHDQLGGHGGKLIVNVDRLLALQRRVELVASQGPRPR